MTGTPKRETPGCRNLLNDFNLSASCEDGACDADQTGGDGDSDACNRRPFTFRYQQIGFPYGIDETQPSDGSDGERDPDYLKGRGGLHALRLFALFVEMVAA